MMKNTLLLTGVLTAAVVLPTLAQERHWDGPPRGGDGWNYRYGDHDRRDNRRDVRRNDEHRLRYAPRRGAVVREYVYYPNARAYYAPWNHRWYHRKGNRWVVTQNAPVNINLGNGISISLGADSPTVYDSYVMRNYRSYYR